MTELLLSGYLREVPKFSKFVHGTAFLRRGGTGAGAGIGVGAGTGAGAGAGAAGAWAGAAGRPVAELPYWWSDEWKGLWARNAKEKDGDGKPLPLAMLSDEDKTKQMDHDEIPRWSNTGSSLHLGAIWIRAGGHPLLRLTASAVEAAHRLLVAVATCKPPWGSSPEGA